jgi:hypothetical protein
MKKLHISYLILLTSYISCQPALVAEFEDRPVVESYLYAGEPVRVSVARLVPFRDDVSFSEEDVNRLSLVITDETTGTDYALTAKGDSGIYTGGSFLPEAGHAYRLQFMYNGTLVTADTEIAPVPENAQFSRNTIPAGGGGGGGGMSEPITIKITWDNPSGDYYIVMGVCTENNPIPVFEFDDDDDDDDDDEFEFPLSFQTEVTQDASVELTSQSFSYRGQYTVRLCRIQPEYVVLYQRMSNRSENLAELNANVVNGYGIFTGVSSVNHIVTVYVN